jgi:hypothetical protein
VRIVLFVRGHLETFMVVTTRGVLLALMAKARDAVEQNTQDGLTTKNQWAQDVSNTKATLAC